MNKVVLTTTIDASLNAALEDIARFDGRSPADIADQAIRNLVEERVATRELLNHGLNLIDGGRFSTLSSEAIHDWLLSEEDAEFPKGSQP